MDAKKRIYNLITGKNADIDLNKKSIKTELNNNCYLVYLKCYDFDKYGRVLGDIYKDENSDESFSSILIKEKLAYVYSGKTKLTEQEQIELLK
jgi:endonuclease YncB( thermonuclease family)